KDYSDVWLEHLNELEIGNFANLKVELKFMKLILAKSSVLKKIFRKEPFFGHDNKDHILHGKDFPFDVMSMSIGVGGSVKPLIKCNVGAAPIVASIWHQEPRVAQGAFGYYICVTIICMVLHKLSPRWYIKKVDLTDVGIVDGLSARTKEVLNCLTYTFLYFPFSISLALALAKVDKTTIGSLTADVVADTIGVGLGYANNDGLASDLKVWLEKAKSDDQKAKKWVS
nr:F-box/FBD/LRR-repeat protein At1g13570-like [Tanacetum cinerariifolium]